MSNSKKQAQAQFDCIYEMVQAYEMDWVRLEELREDFGADNTLVGYCPDPLDAKLHAEYYTRGPETTNKFLELGILYEYTEEGRQAAILHSKAMLGIV